jgi:hypothetical protein
VTRREYISKELPSSALSILSGDLRGEGTFDLLITDGRGLSLYTWEQGGLIWKWEDAGPRGRHVLALDSGDLDGDGIREVLVTSVNAGRLRTRVISWGQGEWSDLGGAEGLYVRVFEKPGGGNILLGQRSGVNTVFAGGVREHLWEDGSFRPTDGPALPAGVDILGLVLADVDGDDAAEILSLNDAGNLRVYSREGEMLYQTGERFGGYPVRVDPRDLFGPQLSDGTVEEGFFTSDTTDELSGKDLFTDLFAAFQGRVMSWREEADGRVYVAVPRNLSGPGKVLPNLRQFDKGVTVLLRWEEGRLVEVLRSRKQEGYVSDVALADTDGDGRQEVLMAVNRPSGALLRKKGTLVVWRYHQQGREGGGGE